MGTAESSMRGATRTIATHYHLAAAEGEMGCVRYVRFLVACQACSDSPQVNVDERPRPEGSSSEVRAALRNLRSHAQRYAANDHVYELHH